MRLLALLTDGHGASGGIAQYNRDLMAALLRSSDITEVVVLPRFGTAVLPMPDRIVQAAPSTGRIAWSLRAAGLGMWRSFDAVFCGHLHAAPLAALIARVLAKPLWLQAHGIEAWSRPNAAIRRATAQARLVTAVSRHTRQRLLQWSDIDPAKVRVLPNTVAPAYAPRERPAHLVDRHGLAGRHVILTVGRLAAAERYKGHDRVIAALPDVLLQCPRAVYLIAGSGDDQPRLEAAARTAGVDDRVVFTGRIADAELPDYYRLADVFAMPSTGEGFGIVLLEAAASGLPVIAGNRDGCVDALADGALGTLIDPDDRTQLVSALIAALDGRSRTNPRAVQRFAFEHFAGHVDDLVRHHLR